MDATWKETEADKLLAAALGHPDAIVHGPPGPVVLANPPDVRKLTPLQKRLLELQQQSDAMLIAARNLDIQNPEDYERGGLLIAKSKDMEKTFNALLRPSIDEDHKKWKGGLARLKGYTDPLQQAQGVANTRMSVWRVEEARKTAEAEAKLRETARLEEEARQLEQAVQLEKAGRVEAAEYVASKPVTTPVVHIESTVPKIPGQSIRKLWRARVVDAALVPDQYKVIDMTGLNALARSLKERAQVPGVEFYSEETTAQRRV